MSGFPYSTIKELTALSVIFLAGRNNKCLYSSPTDKRFISNATWILSGMATNGKWTIRSTFDGSSNPSTRPLETITSHRPPAPISL